MKLKYFFLDVFTRRAFAGNQLAVVLMQDWLDADTLLNIAREFGFSETAFLKPMVKFVETVRPVADSATKGAG